MRLVSMRKLLVAVLLMSVSLGLGACRESEQDRFKIYEQGVYKGKKDDTLSADVRTAVRNRAVEQSGAQIGGGPIGKVTGDVRPPE